MIFPAVAGDLNSKTTRPLADARQLVARRVCAPFQIRLTHARWSGDVARCEPLYQRAWYGGSPAAY